MPLTFYHLGGLGRIKVTFQTRLETEISVVSDHTEGGDICVTKWWTPRDNDGAEWLWTFMLFWFLSAFPCPCTILQSIQKLLNDDQKHKLKSVPYIHLAWLYLHPKAPCLTQCCRQYSPISSVGEEYCVLHPFPYRQPFKGKDFALLAALRCFCSIVLLRQLINISCWKI